MSAERSGLALVGAVAKLLNAGMGTDATVAAVAETVRQGVGAASVTLWMRSPGAASFRAVCAPPAADTPAPVASLEAAPTGRSSRRLPLEHENLVIGLLDLALPPGSSDAPAEALTVIADLLAPYLASLELSEDLAGEVVAQSREIEAQERFISLVIDSLPVGLYVVDRDYRIQLWNRKRETGTQGLRRGEVVGRAVFNVLTRQAPEQLRAEFDRIFETGEIQQSELEVAHGDEVRHFRLSKIPMRLEGDAITHVITIGEDVTESRAVQGRILQAEKLAAIGQLAAGVMHEINNPLATIAVCVAAMQGRLDDGEAAAPALGEYLDIIDREVQRCTGIVDRLLDFSRPKDPVRAPVSLNELVDETLFLLKHHQRFRRLGVGRELAPDLPPALGSREQLIQVLMALMINAADAVEQGGELTVRTGRSDPRSGEVFVDVADTGPGIPREHRDKIFEPFFTTKPPGRGTGLGLSVCYAIVEAHRGRIEVDSSPGRGARFRVSLPIGKAP